MLLKIKYIIISLINQVFEFIKVTSRVILYWIESKWEILHVEHAGKESIPINLNEIRLFCVMRNEALRLPHFLKYYKDLGVDRFFFLDNNSTDHSRELLKYEPNTHIFTTSSNYKNHWIWMEYLLNAYGRDHWCIVVDVDELFCFPGKGELSLRNLCEHLDSKQDTAVRSLLLDMYPAHPLNGTTYRTGENPVDVAPHFDKNYFSTPFSFLDKKNMVDFSTVIFTGGMRDRVFGRSNPPSILSKISLFKHLSKTYLVQGMHAVSNAQISAIQGVVFHTKFLFDFIGEVEEECRREQHYDGAFYYKIFNNTLRKNPDLSLYCNESVEFRDFKQLIDLEIMKTTADFEVFTARKVAKAENV